MALLLILSSVKGYDINKSPWRGHTVRYAPLVLWVGVIFFLSSDQGSAAETSRIIRPIIEFFFPTASPDTFLIVHSIIRKTAHFTEYGMLAIFAARAFSASSVQLLKNHWVVIALVLILSIATFDEINQSFESSRTASIWDVLLDFTGGFSMTCLFWIFRKPRSHFLPKRAVR